MLPPEKNGTYFYDNYGNPISELIGYDVVCDDWRIGVLVNRHFKQGYEWNYEDFVFDGEGKYRYCLKWRKVPRFRLLYPNGFPWANGAGSNGNGMGPNGVNGNGINGSKNGQGNDNGAGSGTGAGPNGGANGLGANGNPPGALAPTITINKIRVEVPCSDQLSVVLNDREFNVPKKVKDKLGKKCSIWLSPEQVEENFKQRQERMAKKANSPKVAKLPPLKAKASRTK